MKGPLHERHLGKLFHRQPESRGISLSRRRFEGELGGQVIGQRAGTNEIGKGEVPDIDDLQLDLADIGVLLLPPFPAEVI